jgi:hypothetical protein
MEPVSEAPVSESTWFLFNLISFLAQASTASIKTNK